LYKALSTQSVNIENIIRSYNEYMSFAVDNPPTQKEYLRNMELKMQDKEFLNDTNLLLRPDYKYNPLEAWEMVRDKLILRM